MKLIDKIVNLIWNSVVANPLERSNKYANKHINQKDDPKIKHRIEKLASMGLGMDLYNSLQAKAQVKADSLMKSESSNIFKFYFTIFFYLYRLEHWLKKPFFLFEII